MPAVDQISGKKEASASLTRCKGTLLETSIYSRMDDGMSYMYREGKRDDAPKKMEKEMAILIIDQRAGIFYAISRFDSRGGRFIGY